MKKPEYIIKNSKYLRNNMTDAEKRLWYYLRKKQFSGIKFRRQQPIDHYIVDFVSLKNKLIIELDGGQHGWETSGDSNRDHYLKNKGFRVLRFWNNEVMENIEGVLKKIVDYLESPLPSPPREGEGIIVEELV